MTGIKYDSEKPKMHLLPPKAIFEVAKVLTFGANKYDEENWRKLESLETRYISGALRHIFHHNSGDTLDEESGLSHLAHALCCLLFTLEIQLEDKEEESREFDRLQHTESIELTLPDEWGESDNKSSSVPDAEYSVQYSTSDPCSGGL